MGTGRGAIEVSENYEWGGKDPKEATTFAAQRPNWELPIWAIARAGSRAQRQALRR